MESIPYDKRSGKFGLTVKPLIGLTNIHILNHGLHYASCVFEERYEGEIFKLEDHTKRLYSAKRMEFKFPIPRKKSMKPVRI